MIRDIRKLIDQEVINALSFEVVETMDRKGECRPAYNLDFHATMVLVTGYDPHRRAAVIKEWDYLRNQQPKELSRMEILQLAVESEQRAIQLETERDQAIRDLDRACDELKVLLREMFDAEESYGCGFYNEDSWIKPYEKLKEIIYGTRST